MQPSGFDEQTVLAGVVVLLFAAATGAMVLGELLIAGILFFVSTFVIYLREVRD